MLGEDSGKRALRKGIVRPAQDSSATRAGKDRNRVKTDRKPKRLHWIVSVPECDRSADQSRQITRQCKSPACPIVGARNHSHLSLENTPYLMMNASEILLQGLDLHNVARAGPLHPPVGDYAARWGPADMSTTAVGERDPLPQIVGDEHTRHRRKEGGGGSGRLAAAFHNSRSRIAPYLPGLGVERPERLPQRSWDRRISNLREANPLALPASDSICE